ncbi:hypothetical protein [Lactococcus lactis]|uniref:hypothetical protein n=1 Tax=Lactococcus lactis TaxID=1358 RepID=UPI001F5975FC|nr:hypothetical protein [Lactococcus lactis]
MKKIRQKMKENVAATKFWIFIGLVALQGILLLGTFFAHDKQIVPASQLVISQTFSDGSGTIEITHQEYDAKNKIMKLDLQATEDISMSQLTPKLFVKNGTGSMQYVPTIDNKAEIFIKDISNNFQALSLSFKNNDLSNQSVDTTIYDNSQEAQIANSAQTESSEKYSSDLIYFFIASNSPYLKQAKKPIKIESQAAYAVEAIQSEIDFQNSQKKKMDVAIEDLNKNQKTTSQKIEELQVKNQYLTGNNLNNNQSKISSLQADIAEHAQQIQEAEQNKKVITQAVIKMRKQISDIQSGKFKFTDDVKSQKLK